MFPSQNEQTNIENKGRKQKQVVFICDISLCALVVNTQGLKYCLQAAAILAKRPYSGGVEVCSGSGRAEMIESSARSVYAPGVKLIWLMMFC